MNEQTKLIHTRRLYDSQEFHSSLNFRSKKEMKSKALYRCHCLLGLLGLG
jgi:hypothetical protein